MLADAVTKPRMVFSSVETCPKAPSAVEIISWAVWLLVTAWPMLVMLLCNAWLAIRPDGLSAPELICKPVLKRVIEVCRLFSVFANDCWASSELTFVIIRVMRKTSPKWDDDQARPDAGTTATSA